MFYLLLLNKIFHFVKLTLLLLSMVFIFFVKLIIFFANPCKLLWSKKKSYKGEKTILFQLLHNEKPLTEIINNIKTIESVIFEGIYWSRYWGLILSVCQITYFNLTVELYHRLLCCGLFQHLKRAYFILDIMYTT